MTPADGVAFVRPPMTPADGVAMGPPSSYVRPPMTPTDGVTMVASSYGSSYRRVDYYHALTRCGTQSNSQHPIDVAPLHVAAPSGPGTPLQVTAPSGPGTPLQVAAPSGPD